MRQTTSEVNSLVTCPEDLTIIVQVYYPPSQLEYQIDYVITI